MPSDEINITEPHVSVRADTKLVKSNKIDGFHLNYLAYPSKLLIRLLSGSDENHGPPPPFLHEMYKYSSNLDDMISGIHGLLKSIHRLQGKNLSSVNTASTQNSRNTSAGRDCSPWRVALNWKSEVLVSCHNLASQKIFIFARSKSTWHEAECLTQRTFRWATLVQCVISGEKDGGKDWTKFRDGMRMYVRNITLHYGDFSMVGTLMVFNNNI